MNMEEQSVKQCCATFYGSDLARYLLGDSFHPGGTRLTERLGNLLALTPESHVLDVASGRLSCCEPKARNMHSSKRERRITGTGGKDQTAVMGLLERGGTVRTKVISSRKKKELHTEVKKHVEAGAALYTDALMSYRGLEKDFVHQVVDHAVEYVNGRGHTYGLENFCSLLKRGINGTYVSIERFHLFRYLDEQSFRFNNRKLTDAQRFDIAMRGMVGKRLTYAEVTGKVVGVEAF